jgi:hypothetical protein
MNFLFQRIDGSDWAPRIGPSTVAARHIYKHETCGGGVHAKGKAAACSRLATYKQSSCRGVASLRTFAAASLPLPAIIGSADGDARRALTPQMPVFQAATGHRAAADAAAAVFTILSTRLERSRATRQLW